MMLDDRLLGLTFFLPDNHHTGTIEFYGVLYHYQVAGPAHFEDLMVVVQITPLHLIVRCQTSVLEY